MTTVSVGQGVGGAILLLEGLGDHPRRSPEVSKLFNMAAVGGTASCKRHVGTLCERQVQHGPHCGSFLSMMEVCTNRQLVYLH